MSDVTKAEQKFYDGLEKLYAKDDGKISEIEQKALDFVKAEINKRGESNALGVLGAINHALDEDRESLDKAKINLGVAKHKEQETRGKAATAEVEEGTNMGRIDRSRLLNGDTRFTKTINAIVERAKVQRDLEVKESVHEYKTEKLNLDTNDIIAPGLFNVLKDSGIKR